MVVTTIHKLQPFTIHQRLGNGEWGMGNDEWGMVNAKCVRLPPSKIVGEWGMRMEYYRDHEVQARAPRGGPPRKQDFLRIFLIKRIYWLLARANYG